MQLNKKILLGLFFCFIIALPLHAQILSSGGTGNTFTLTNYPGNFSGYYDGLPVIFRADHANSGACTISINGYTSSPIVNTAGNQLTAGEVKVNQIISLVYDLPGDRFQMISTSGIISASPTPSDASLAYPGGIAGATSIAHSFSAGSFSAPVGYNVIVTNYYSSTSSGNPLKINGVTIIDGGAGDANNAGATRLKLPIILNNTSGLLTGAPSTSFVGFQTLAGVTPITLTSLTTLYIVPPGKTLVVLQIYIDNTTSDFQVSTDNGSTFHKIKSGRSNYFDITNSPLESPIVLTTGTQIKSNSTTTAINGYLK